MKGAMLSIGRAIANAPDALGRAAVAAALGLVLATAQAADARAQTEGAADAQQGLTLAGALTAALRPGNPTIEQQNDNVQNAAGRAQEASGEFDWNTHVEGGWQLLYVPKPVGGVLTDTTSTVSSYYYDANIGRKFRNGIEVDPGVTAYPGAGATPAQTAGLTQLRPSLGLKVPLLQGFGTESADAAERAAQDALESARKNRGFALQQYAQNVATTFWRCVADDLVLQEAQDADRNSAAYGDTLAKMVKQGVVEPTVQQQWTANHVSEHLNVDKAQDESQKCRRDLAYAVTGSLDEPWPAASGELPNVADLAPAVSQISEGAMDDLAIAQRQDLKAAADTLMAARENLRTADDSTRPELDIHLDPDRAIVSLTKSLGNNTANGRRAEADAAEDQADLALRQLQDQVRMQVSDAIANLRRAASDWATLDQAEKQMESVVGDAEKRARFGSISWADFFAAQNQLSQLRQQVIDARLQFAVALGALRLATGAIDADEPAVLAGDLTKLPTP